jgi:hypothetical protein
MPRLCRLTRKVQQDFINIERPNAFVDRTYARVAATLGQPGEYPTHSVGLAKRILHDGMQHESRFNAIKAALEPFKDNEGQYLRPMDQIGDTAAAIAYRDRIIKALEDAYTAAAGNDIGKSNEQVVGARTAMRDLLQIGEDLSKANVRIPFFDRWPKR